MTRNTRLAAAVAGLLSTLLVFLPATAATKHGGLRGLHSVRIVVTPYPQESEPVGEELRRVGISVADVVRAVKDTLREADASLKQTNRGQYFLSVRVLAIAPEDTNDKIVAASADLRVLSVTSRGGEAGLADRPRLLWESHVLWPTSRTKLRSDVVESIKSQTRYLLAAHGTANARPGRLIPP